MTAAVSGGKVWEIPNPSDVPTAKTLLTDKVFGGSSLLATLVVTVLGGFFLHQSMANGAIVDEAKTAPGAVPVVIASAGLGWQQALISVSSILLVIFLFLLACHFGTIERASTALVVSTLVFLLIGVFAQVMSLMMLSMTGGAGGAHKIHTEWVQENYNLTLVDRLEANTGQVKAETSDGQEMILKVLRFNDSTYLYQTDAELLELMEKLKE